MKPKNQVKNQTKNQTKNQNDIIRQRRPVNIVLTLLATGLSAWIAYLFYQEIARSRQTLTSMASVNHIVIERNEGDIANRTIELRKDNDQWHITQPYQTKASTVVIDTLLRQLQIGCQSVDREKLSRTPAFYADIHTNDQYYQVGELNTAADKVYVLDNNHQTLRLCDKLLASIALAPAINYMDKQLFQGDLRAIRGQFGDIKDFKGIDLSVLEIAPANSNKLPQHGLSELTFISDAGQTSYRVLPPSADDNGQHLLLFDANKSVIYVIAAHSKLTAILGR